MLEKRFIYTIGVKINGQIVVIDINEISLNVTCLHKNLNNNFNCLLNNLGTIRICRHYQEKSEMCHINMLQLKNLDILMKIVNKDND